MKAAIVTTTIHVPTNLEAYANDIHENGPEDTEIIIAGDSNTDPACEAWCNDRGFYYMSPATQIKWLRENGYEEYEKFLPWKSVQRRNVAILSAYHNGAEIIVTIDDDNLWEGDGYFKQHGIGTTAERGVISSSSGWFNVCGYLAEMLWRKFYPRGFSFNARSVFPGEKWTRETGRIVVNAGLWLGDPDIDAVTRIALRPNVISAKNVGTTVLANGTKCPFNSQNTALHRDVIPAYCLATGVGRYDDIIASYVVTRIAHHLGDYISFGRPIVRQVRNHHDLYSDLDDELLGMRLIDRIVDWLYAIPLTGKNYKECIAELIPEFEQKINAWFIDEPVPNDQQQFLRSIVTNYQHWMAVT